MQALPLAVLLFALLTAVFALQNAGPVPVKILFWSFQASLALVILGSAFTGALLSSLLGLGRRRRAFKPAAEKIGPSGGETRKEGGKKGRGATDLAD